jgi:hypothetical protein
METNTHKLIIIGLGRIGMQLLDRLSHEFDITCIELDPAVIAQARSTYPGITVIEGDATSRLVLEQADVDKADTILISMTREKFTLEAARLLHDHFTPARIIGIGITPEGIKTLESYGVEVENIFNAGLVGLLNKIEYKSRSVHGIGLGLNEIREVEIHPNSKLTGKPLTSIGSLKWRVGLIYRDGAIVVPQGDTTLQPRDRAVIMGEPSVLNTVTEILNFRFKAFPHEYGAGLLAAFTGRESDSYVQEIAYLYKTFKLTSLECVFDKSADPDAVSSARAFFERQGIPAGTLSGTRRLSLSEALARLNKSYGFIVLSEHFLKRSYHRALTDRTIKLLLQRLSHSSRSPLLLARGSFPYRKAAAACVEGIDIIHVMENVFEMSAPLNMGIDTLLVEPSPYMSSDHDLRRFSIMKKNIMEMSNIYKMRAGIRVLTGNPISAVLEHLNGGNLLVTDASGWKTRIAPLSFFEPDVAWSVIRGAPLSTLIIPEAEEAF